MKLLEIRKKRWECCREEEMIIEKIENKGRKRIILRNSYNFVRSLWKIQFCYFLSVFYSNLICASWLLFIDFNKLVKG